MQFPRLWSREYRSVPEEDSNLCELDTPYAANGQGHVQRRRRRFWLIGLTLLNVFMFIFSLATATKRRLERGEINAALKATSVYSPILDEIPLRTFTYRVNGSLFADENPGLGRLDPSDEVDAAWFDFELNRIIPISREEVVKLGKDPGTVAKFDDAYWGLGNETYMAQMDVFHQIHCLNTLRGITIADFYGREAPHRRSKAHWEHVKHCTDILLQNIMCHGSTELFTLSWMETQDFPFPDFNINKQCRDFDALVRYRDEKSVSVDKWLVMKKPEGVREIPAPRQYYEIFGPQPKSGGKSMQHHQHS